MLYELHKLFQTRFPTCLCDFCHCSLCFTRFNAFTFPPLLWDTEVLLAAVLQTGTIRSVSRRLSALWLAGINPGETHKGDAAAVSAQSRASAANLPSVGRYKCANEAPSLWPSATLGWWVSWCFRPLDKSLHCPHLHTQDTVCAWREGGTCVWSSREPLLLVTVSSLLLCSSLVPV